MKYAVIGKDINYSLSPIIHNANFQSLNINAHYDIQNINDITEEIGKIRHFFGFNVTIPYKEQIIKFCEELDEDAAIIGAVNCVKVMNQKLYGYNTDVYGFCKLLEINKLLNLPKAKVLIIGAGGAGKAVYHCFKKYTDYEIVVTNRTIEKALKFAKNVISLQDAKNQLSKYDIIINATNLGVKEPISPIPLTNINTKTFFIDINYKNTQFLEEAKFLNAITINGLDMLLYQAAKSFEIWFSQKANIEAMENSLRRKD